MIAVLGDTKKVLVTYGAPTDAKGFPAPIQPGSLVWKTSDPTFATVTPATEDPIAGTIVAGAPGVCEIWPEADADLGDGVVTIIGEKVGVQVTAGQASVIGSPTLGTIEDQ